MNNIVTETHYYFLTNWMSNFAHSVFTDGVNTYQNTEQYFMYQKAIFFGDDKTAQDILNATTPNEAKTLGRQVKNYDDYKWNMVRYHHMYIGNLLKYTQNPELGNKLKGTNNLILVECNPRDPIWGIGLSAEEAVLVTPNEWKGKNLLGRVLMDVRKVIRHEFDDYNAIT